METEWWQESCASASRGKRLLPGSEGEGLLGGGLGRSLFCEQLLSLAISLVGFLGGLSGSLSGFLHCSQHGLGFAA